MKCFVVDSVLTDVNGRYYFDSLIAGKYLIEIAASNFAPGGPLANFVSSTGNGANTSPGSPYEVPGAPIDADVSADNADHGVKVTTGMFAGSVLSDTLNLGSNEPLAEDNNDTTALDSLGNMTMDFGFVEIFSIGK